MNFTSSFQFILLIDRKGEKIYGKRRRKTGTIDSVKNLIFAKTETKSTLFQRIL